MKLLDGEILRALARAEREALLEAVAQLSERIRELGEDDLSEDTASGGGRRLRPADGVDAADSGQEPGSSKRRPGMRSTGAKVAAAQQGKAEPVAAGSAVAPRPASGEKTCTRCGATKPLDAFVIEKRTRAGRSAQCKACIAKAAAERYAARHQDRAPAPAAPSKGNGVNQSTDARIAAIKAAAERNRARAVEREREREHDAGQRGGSR